MIQLENTAQPPLTSLAASKKEALCYCILMRQILLLTTCSTAAKFVACAKGSMEIDSSAMQTIHSFDSNKFAL